MPINDNSNNQEDIAQAREDQSKAMSEISDQLIKDMGLEADLKKQEPVPLRDEVSDNLNSDSISDDGGYAAEEDSDEVDTESGHQDEDSEEYEEQPETDEIDEDLVPKSKMQKRIDELTAQIRRLEAKDRAAQEKQDASSEDPDLKRLEGMNETDLKQLKRQVRRAQLQNQDDEDKLDQLMDLEEKIDRTIQSAPQRFQSKQVSAFNKAVEDTYTSIDNWESAKNDIFNYAKQVYERSKTLQKSADGQADAWYLAVEHYKALSDASSKVPKSNNAKIKNLKSQVNKLKRKTSLDSGLLKGNVSKDTKNKLWERAKSGTLQDKHDWVKNTIVTDDLLEH